MLRFPLSYGSTHVEHADVDHDGAVDILYAAGDNADYPLAIKPYHGILIYLNDGQNRFEEPYFSHLNGAYDPVARDFDGDDDLDIAATSFFPDYENRPEESFVDLENKGDLEFEGKTFSNSPMGRWLTPDTGDVHDDGDVGVIIGAFSALQLGTSYFRRVGPIGGRRRDRRSWFSRRGRSPSDSRVCPYEQPVSRMDESNTNGCDR